MGRGVGGGGLNQLLIALLPIYPEQPARPLSGYTDALRHTPLQFKFLTSVCVCVRMETG